MSLSSRVGRAGEGVGLHVLESPLHSHPLLLPQPHCCHGDDYHTESSRGSDLSDIMEEDEEELYSEMQLEDGGRRRPSGTSHNALKVSAGALPPPTAVPTVPHPCSFGGLCSWLEGPCPAGTVPRFGWASLAIESALRPKVWVKESGRTHWESLGHPALY